MFDQIYIVTRGYSCSIVWGEELMDISLDDASLPRTQVTNHQHFI